MLHYSLAFVLVMDSCKVVQEMIRNIIEYKKHDYDALYQSLAFVLVMDSCKGAARYDQEHMILGLLLLPSAAAAIAKVLVLLLVAVLGPMLHALISL